MYGHRSGFRVFVLFSCLSFVCEWSTKRFCACESWIGTGCSPHLGRNSLNQVQCLGVDKFKGWTFSSFSDFVCSKSKVIFTAWFHANHWVPLICWQCSLLTNTTSKKYLHACCWPVTSPTTELRKHFTAIEWFILAFVCFCGESFSSPSTRFGSICWIVVLPFMLASTKI